MKSEGSGAQLKVSLGAVVNWIKGRFGLAGFVRMRKSARLATSEHMDSAN